MGKYKIEHHQIIESALNYFNADFFCENNIIFGGGTRIALELDEFRESIDIDLLCPNRDSYRAVREQVTNVTLGELVKAEFKYIREIRADRDAVRTVIELDGTKIKLEFVSFDNYELTSCYDPAIFPVPFLDHTSCFYTKLLANADRKLIPPYKDIFDIIAMYKAWGSIPEQAIKLAEKHYSEKVIIPDLIESLNALIQDQKAYEKVATSLKMKPKWIQEVIAQYSSKLLAELTDYKRQL